MPPLLRLISGILVASLASTTGNPSAPWVDNEQKFRSNDPSLNVRRSDHFRILWGQGTGNNPDENTDFKGVSEELVRGNLQMLESVWQRFHQPPPYGLGFHIPGESSIRKSRDGRNYRANLLMNNTGIWAGGAWGSCDEFGLPLFALPPSYLAYDPPSGATPHEYAHTVLINAAAFNDTPYDGMWHEATANWLMLQFNNNYPGPGGVGMQPFLSVPHGRNYYDCWQLWEYFRETPPYGTSFINRIWTEGRGSRRQGAEYIYDAMVRLHPPGSPDPYNAIKDAIGHMAARNVMWDYQRQPFFQHHAKRTLDPFSEIYRRAYTELERRANDPNWFRVPFAHAPMQGGYNVIPIALPEKSSEPYPVSIHFKPLWDSTRRSDWRATLVAVNDQGGSRYSSMWNSGVNSITLSPDENQLFLAVAATPDFQPYEGFQRPLPSNPTLQPQAYEIAFVNTKATAWESKPSPPPQSKGNPHPNGGGFVAHTASVAPSAYVGPNALVLDQAQVLDHARIEDYATVAGRATVRNHAVVSGHALVQDNASISNHAKVRDWATVGGSWQIRNQARALERAWLMDRGELTDHATIKGATSDYGGAKVTGHAIKEADCANSANIDRQTLMCWVWGIDQKYADERPSNEQLYCNFDFSRTSPIYALDKHGMLHGYLMGGPTIVKHQPSGPTAALQLAGQGQYVELKRDVADFTDTTIALWVNWAGGPAGQQLLHFGDGNQKYMSITPKDADSGKLRFVITTSGRSGEQELTAPALIPNRWTHLAVTLKDDTGTLFVNGIPADSNAAMTLNPHHVLAPNTLASNASSFLGRGPTGNYFLGWLADFRTYLAPQDPATISQLAKTVTDPTPRFIDPPKQAAHDGIGSNQFLMPPTPTGPTSVTMSAPKPPPSAGPVEYCFTRDSTTGPSSGWISSNRWVDPQLSPGQSASYSFKTRDANHNESPPSPAVSVTLPTQPATPTPSFAKAPLGTSPTSIHMTATPIPSSLGHVEYLFERNDGKSSGWQADPRYTDRNLTDGTTHSYTVTARINRGKPGSPSSPASATARDDTPPARYPLGEWQTVPFATLSNTIRMKAMSVTGENGCPKIEQDEVEYSFECLSGNGPNSGWIPTPVWETPSLKDGTYQYAFKIRDRSPQQNETPPSAPESATISPQTGYREFNVAEINRLPEGTLVAFSGKITKVEPSAYLITHAGTTVRVVPNTTGGKTDPSRANATVSVKGSLWKHGNETRVVWASLESPNPS